MSLSLVLIVVFVAGALGGLVNALLSENGFILPKKQLADRSGKEEGIWRPGYLGNILVGAVAAVISWGLYGPFSSTVLFGASIPEAVLPHITLSAFVGAILVGVGGAKWLSDEVDKRLLKAAASEAAKKEASVDVSRQIALSSPAGALSIARGM